MCHFYLLTISQRLTVQVDMTDLSTVFFEAKASLGSAANAAQQTRNLLDTAVANNDADRLLPRCSSERADQFIERMVETLVSVRAVVADEPHESDSSIGSVNRQPATLGAAVHSHSDSTTEQRKASHTEKATTTTTKMDCDDDLTASQKEELANGVSVSMDDDESEEGGDMYYSDTEINQAFHGEVLYESSDDELDNDVGLVQDDSEASTDDEEVHANDRNGTAANTVVDEDEDIEDKRIKQTMQTDNKQIMSEQKDRKRKREAEFVSSSDDLTRTLTDYVYVAGMQHSGIGDNFRKMLLSEEQTTPHAIRLTQSVLQLEAEVRGSVSLARRAAPVATQQIIDLVKGADKVEASVAERSGRQCDVLERLPRDKEQMWQVTAYHTETVAGQRSTVLKRRVMCDAAQGFVQAFWFVLNMIDVVGRMCSERLAKMKQYKQRETSVAAALQLLTEDSVKRSVVNQLRSKLKAALNKIDMTGKNLK